MAKRRREDLVQTAVRLFGRDGYHATGIDKILAESGCAKMTLYNHFRSKDELILAALRRRDEGFRNWFIRAVERRAVTPRERLLAVFDVLQDWFETAEFSGCMFINAAAEFNDPCDPIHTAARQHKEMVLSYLRELASAAGAADPDALAEGLVLLMEGAIVMRHVACQGDAARRARPCAEILIDHALA